MMARKLSLPKLVLLALVCLYVLVFGTLAARAYPAHETGALDLGNYDQALWNAAHGRGLSLTLAPHLGPTRFAIHVEPILFLIAPLYRFVTDDPRLLLWLQAIVIALGGLPLYGLARRRLQGEWPALALVAAYYLMPALESVTLFDFHAVGLAPTLLLAALYFMDRALITPQDSRGLWTSLDIKSQISNPKSQISNPKSQISNPKSLPSAWMLSAIFFVLALGTKEDISLHVFMLGLYLLVLRRRWRPGLAFALLGAVWFYLAFYVVIPASRPGAEGSAYTSFFLTLGDTPLEIALSPIRTPGKVVALLVTPENLRALGMLLLPLALLPLVGWPFFILAAPTLAIVLLSSNPLMHRLETYHYAAPAIPFVMLAAVDGLARVKYQISNIKCQIPKGHDVSNGKYPRGTMYPEGTMSPISNLQSRTSHHRRISIFLPLILLAASLVYHYYRGYSPLARPFHWPQVTDHERLGDELAASIPPDVPVIAQAELVPLASHREWIEIWQGPFKEPGEYFFLDISHPAFVNRDGAQESVLSDIAWDPTIGPIATVDGYFLLQRGAARLPTTPDFFNFAYAQPLSGATPVSATFGNELQLVAFETQRNYADRENEPLITLYWRVLNAPAEDYFIAVFLLDEAGKPVGVTRFQQPLTVWLPTSHWEKGQTIRLLANTFSWWTGDRRQFGYGVAVVRGHEPWDVASRLSVERGDDGSAPLDGNTLLPLARFKRVAGIPYQVRGR